MCPELRLTIEPGNERPGRSIHGGVRVLIVDDNPGVRGLLRHLCEDADLEVAEAADGWQAREMLEGGTGFDVVLVDREMPRVDGLELLRWFRGQRRFAHAKAILMTGAAFGREGAIRAGADAFLAKPFEVHDVFGILRAVGVAVVGGL